MKDQLRRRPRVKDLTPTQRHPLLSIADVLRTVGQCSLNDLYGALQGELQPDVTKKALDTLVTLGRLKIAGDVATWQPDAD